MRERRKRSLYTQKGHQLSSKVTFLPAFFCSIFFHCQESPQKCCSPWSNRAMKSLFIQFTTLEAKNAKKFFFPANSLTTLRDWLLWANLRFSRVFALEWPCLPRATRDCLAFVFFCLSSKQRHIPSSQTFPRCQDSLVTWYTWELSGNKGDFPQLAPLLQLFPLPHSKIEKTNSPLPSIISFPYFTGNRSPTTAERKEFFFFSSHLLRLKFHLRKTARPAGSTKSVLGQ